MRSTTFIRGGVVDRRADGRRRHQGVRFEGTRFVGLRGMRDWVSYEGCEFVGCEFVDCEVDATFAGALADPESASRFLETRFVRSHLAHAYLGGVRLERCQFDDCDLEGANWDSLDLVECTFLGIVSGLTLSATSGPISRPPPLNREKLPPRRNVIVGNDFSAAELRGLGLRHGVPVQKQLWPSEPEYVVLDRLPERVAAVLHRLGEADDPHSRVVRRLLANEAATGQESDLYRFDDPSMPEAHHMMVRMLAQVHLA